eukprot:GEMP01040154.1.p1 GENE.GEMP01040154.1~~GEMP01040154.1.p1  ORF type:complete len:517 (+),score=94.39 GEMP01040154.1:83-1633(+)
MSRVQGRYLNGDSVLVGTCKTIGSTLVAIAILHHRFASAIVLLCPTTTKNLTDFHTETPPPIVSIIIKSEEENELPSEDDFRITLRLHAEHEDTATCVRALEMLRHADFAVPLVTEVLLHAARDDEPEAHREILCTLVRAGADATGALLEAASDGAGQNAVERLLSASVSPDIADSNGDTALIVASREGCKVVVEAVLSAGANIEHVNVNPVNWGGDTALIIASRKGHVDVVETLISARANIAHLNDCKASALTAASHVGWKDVVEALLSVGCNVNQPDIWGFHPLFRAVADGHKDVVELLLRAEADVNLQNRYPHAASMMDSSWTWKIKDNMVPLSSTLQMYPPLNDDQPNTKGGFTVLCGAVMRGHKDVVRVLLAALANVNHVTDEGETPLSYASQYGHDHMVETLVSAGARIDHVDVDGETALFNASRNGHTNTVEALVSAGVRVNHANVDGETALFVASRHGHKNTVEALVSAGANVNHANVDGDTALAIATSHRRKVVAEALLSAGAKCSY